MHIFFTNQLCSCSTERGKEVGVVTTTRITHATPGRSDFLFKSRLCVRDFLFQNDHLRMRDYMRCGNPCCCKIVVNLQMLTEDLIAAFCASLNDVNSYVFSVF
jgi:hypothetical protein